MNVSDDELRDALQEDYDPGREEGLGTEIRRSFQGRMRWVVIVAWLEGLALTGVCVWAAFQFFGAEGIREHVGWATLFSVTAVCVVAIKIWYHNWLNRNAVLREVKRLELQIADLRRRLGEA